MARQGRNNWVGGGQTLLVIGGALLMLNIFSTFRSISGTGIDFFTMFFITIGENGQTSPILLAYVWGPFILLPLGLILFLIGMRKPPRENQETDAAMQAFTQAGGVQTGVAQPGSGQPGADQYGAAPYDSNTGTPGYGSTEEGPFDYPHDSNSGQPR